MKVLCIDTRDNPYVKVKEGEVYSAAEGDSKAHSEPVYFIHEVTQHIYKRRFIPLSNIDETELIQEREQYHPEFQSYLIQKYTDLLPKSRSVAERAFRRAELYRLKQLNKI